jgi:hypothetical protein
MLSILGSRKQSVLICNIISICSPHRSGGLHTSLQTPWVKTKDCLTPQLLILSSALPSHLPKPAWLVEVYMGSMDWTGVSPHCWSAQGGRILNGLQDSIRTPFLHSVIAHVFQIHCVVHSEEVQSQDEFFVTHPNSQYSPAQSQIHQHLLQD